MLSAVIFIGLDFLWLAVIASPWYKHALGYLSQLSAEGKITFNIPAGLVAQLAISLTLSFVIMLSLQVDNRLVIALLVGGFIGLAIYACYDFTNLSFVKGWPLWISLIDVGWGTLQGILAGIYVYFMNQHF